MSTTQVNWSASTHTLKALRMLVYEGTLINIDKTELGLLAPNVSYIPFYSCATLIIA